MTPVLELGLVYALLALASLAARRLHTSAVPVFVAAGMLGGPHGLGWGDLDLRLVRDPAVVDFLGQVGLLLLLLLVGLEVSLPRLLRSGRPIAVGGGLSILLTAGPAAALGAAWDLPRLEILALAGMAGVSSTAIVARILIELRRTANPETELILGIMMVQDIFLALYLTALSGMLLGGALRPERLLVGGALAVLFIAGLLVAGHVGRRLLDRALADLPQEPFLLLVFALLLVVAGAGETLHVAEAVGALLVGLILAGTAHRQAIEERLLPARDLTAAMFFFAFGASVPPGDLPGVALPVLALAGVTLLGSLAAGLVAAWWGRLSLRAGARMGLTIVARGEFSLLLAVVAQRGRLDPWLQPLAALYVLVLALASPSLARHANALADALGGPGRWLRGRPAGAGDPSNHQGNRGATEGAAAERPPAAPER